MLFAEVLRQLDGAGFIVKTGTLIDATLVRSSARTPPSGSTPQGQESRVASDPDANWTREAAIGSCSLATRLTWASTRGRGWCEAAC